MTPLAVAGQMQREASAFDIKAGVIRSMEDVTGLISICNYERLDSLTPQAFRAIILDESSILKGFSGKTRWALTRAFEAHRFHLAATATPAPNDHTELDTHSHFLGVMETQEMFARWFVHDSGRTQDWRLKGHAIESFWSWVASWSRCVSMPSDLGYSDEGFALPPIEYIPHNVDVDLMTGRDEGHFFRMLGASATEIHKEKRLTLEERAAKVAEIVQSNDKAWIVWCDTDYEADAIRKLLPKGDFLEVRGSMPLKTKEANLQAFSDGNVRIILTKPSIAGFGLNWQHCCRQVFAGLSFSYESLYQAVRRSWRFGQKNAVQVHVILSPAEQHAWSIVLKKSAQHETMKSEMRVAMKRAQNPQQRRRLNYHAEFRRRGLRFCEPCTITTKTIQKLQLGFDSSWPMDLFRKGESMKDRSSKFDHPILPGLFPVTSSPESAVGPLPYASLDGQMTDPFGREVVRARTGALRPIPQWRKKVF